MGIYEAFGGIVRHPYIGAKIEGPIGFGKGIGRGIWGFGCHILAGMYIFPLPSPITIVLIHALGRQALTSHNAAMFALPGYSLKGIERELSKRGLTTLQAELYLIRLRQANRDFEIATVEEKAKVLPRWKELQKSSHV